MMSSLVTHLSFSSAPTVVAVLLAVIALVCGGWAFHAAIYTTTAPSWVRADAAVVAVALYAFAFGRLRMIDAGSAAQILAYAVGFLAASMLEPLMTPPNVPEKPDERE
ncbi:MAG: hypothetical protein U0132_19245 [Gemmatimonadaceae bacterium]